jgi:predicted membrane-bound dolichyl-phosphate-mannose-protein mannosyltransferase
VATLRSHGPIAALVLVAGALRAFRLGDPRANLIGDELWYVQAARVIAGVPVLMHHLSGTAQSGIDPNSEHPSLAKVAMATMIHLMGDREVAWRIPSVVLGTLAIWLIYLVVLQVGGSRREAWFAAFILAFDTLFFIHSRIATLDIYLVTFSLLGTWLYLRSYLELAAVVFAVAALCKANGVLGLMAMYLYEALIHRREWRTPNWRAIGRRALAFGFFVAFFVLGLGALDGFWSEYSGPFEHLAHMVSFHSGIKHVGPSSGTDSNALQWWLNEGSFDYLTWTETKNGVTRRILFRAMMNGYVIFSAPLALLYAAEKCWKDDSRVATFALASVIANYVPIFVAWAVASRTSYIYYMVPVLPGIACALALSAFAVPRYLRWGFAATILYAFLLSFPFRII